MYSTILCTKLMGSLKMTGMVILESSCKGRKEDTLGMIVDNSVKDLLMVDMKTQERGRHNMYSDHSLDIALWHKEGSTKDTNADL